MKRNMLSIVILALIVVNVILSAIIMFVALPSINRTNKIINKVGSIIDLEKETANSDTATENISIEDISTYNVEDKLIVYLKQSSDGSKHYAMLSVTLSINKKHKDTEKYEVLIPQHENSIKEIVTEEFSKYTVENINNNKEAIKNDSLHRIKELFDSDFIINISFGNLTLE